MNPITRTPTYLLLLFLCYQSTAFAFYNPAAGKWLSRDPIGERRETVLYGFVKNSPVSNFDPNGTLTMQYRTLDKQACGNFFVSWFFYLDDPANFSIEGYFVQKVTRSRCINMCKGAPCTEPRPVAIYWEVWENDGTGHGKQGGSVDTFRFNGSLDAGMGPSGSPSWFFERGEMRFYPKSVTGTINWPIGAESGLPQTINPADVPFWDELGAGFPYLEAPAFHSAYASWDCCVCGNKTPATTSLYYSP